jgi:transposase
MFVMGDRRREFSPECKDEAVGLVVNTGRPIAVVAGELGVSD